MPQQLKQHKADKVHLGHRLGIFLHTILQCLWSQVVFFKERDIPSRKRGLTLCLPFERLQCLFEKSAVMVWKNQNKLIRIQFHRNMAPSTNRFQHHSKLRSIYIYIYLYLLMYLYIYIYIPMCFFRSWRSLNWMLTIIWNMFLQKSASSLWKGCKIPSNRKTSFQIST